MRVSRNELIAMVAKAARGAGLPLAHAEDIAAASVDIYALTRDVGSIEQALRCPHRASILQEPDQTSAAFHGPTALDILVADPKPVTLSALDAPIVLMGLLNWANRLGAGVQLTCDGDTVTLSKGKAARLPATPSQIIVDPEHWNALNILAAKTYVPESEASRIAGAGAGLTDND